MPVDRRNILWNMPVEEDISTESNIENKDKSTQTQTQTLIRKHNSKYGWFRFGLLLLQMIGDAIIILLFCWVFIYMKGLDFKNPTLFNWHPILMTIGMIYFNGHSILIYRGFRKTKKSILKFAHATTFAFVMVLVSLGFTAVFVYKDISRFYHFLSPHSWIGLATMGFFVLQWLGGFLSFVFPKLPTKTRKHYLPRHIYFGLAGLILATVAVITGLLRKMSLKECDKAINYSEGMIISSIIILVILFSIFVCLLATDKNFKRIPMPPKKAIDQGS